MDIEDLNKTQLLLLTLLVNFVTSIATGVLTVSLLDDTSPTITQTVNRIVERTVETVSTPVPSLPTIITKPGPAPQVLPTDDERRTAALSADSARRVTIYKNATSKIPLATGTYLPKARAIVTATALLPTEVVVYFTDGSSAPASRSKAGSGLTVYGFADAAVLPQVEPATLVDLSTVKQGLSVLGIAGEGTVTMGIVTKIDTLVSTSLVGVPAGGSAVNLDGSIIGISNGAGGYIPANIVTALLSAPAL